MTMTDNERIQVRVLSVEEIQDVEIRYQFWPEVLSLIATIRDRDKTIAELDRQYAVVATKAINLELQNEVMLSAFERILANEFSTWTLGGFIRDTIAQVKALTVSKQEESTVSEVACEQHTKDSLNVARQNNPTHSTEQINRLAQEVATDMQWREGEKP